MTMNTSEASYKASVTYEWYVDALPRIEQKQHGRRVKIDPRRVRVTANKQRDGDSLTIYIEGQTIRANGTPGQQRRMVAFSDDMHPYFHGEAMGELPSDYRPFLLAARVAESTR